MFTFSVVITFSVCVLCMAACGVGAYVLCRGAHSARDGSPKPSKSTKSRQTLSILFNQNTLSRYSDATYASKPLV